MFDPESMNSPMLAAFGTESGKGRAAAGAPYPGCRYYVDIENELSAAKFDWRI
jgi:hypothetical protein